MNDDLINRADAIEAIHNYWKKRLETLPTEMTEYGEVYADIQSMDNILEHNKMLSNFIKKLPSALPKQGEWIERECGAEDKEDGWETVIVCSRCDFPATTFYSEDCESRTQIRTSFCPNCGARMKGADDE